MTRISDPVHGVLLLDKPLGVSSNHALQRARFALGAAKAGHTGSLDPLATGMLPICFGEATKIAGLLLGGRKRYRASVVLGSSTTTDDAEGEIVATAAVTDDERARVKDVLKSFLGRIRQRPPIYSALKQRGVPLYRRARRGEVVEVSERTVEVFAIDHVAVDGIRVDFEIECGSGTYIRSIARDLGDTLGCGGHLGALRRVMVEPFAGEPMHPLDAVLEEGQAARSHLLPISRALAHFPSVGMAAGDVARFRQGQAIACGADRCTAASMGETVVVHGPGTGLLGLARQGEDGSIQPFRVFHLP